MKCAWVCTVLILHSTTWSAPYESGRSGAFQADSNQTLRSGFEFCQSSVASPSSCRERLIKDIKINTDRLNQPLDRHVDELSEALATALVGRRFNPLSSSQLESAILNILNSAQMSASGLSKNFQDVKIALDRWGIPEKHRNSVTGALLVLSQDVHGPEDKGAQVMPSRGSKMPR